MRNRNATLAIVLSLTNALALPASSARAKTFLGCSFTTTTGGVYPLVLSQEQYNELNNLGYGRSITLKLRGHILTITNVGAETNQFEVTYGNTTVTGPLSCQPLR